MYTFQPHVTDEKIKAQRERLSNFPKITLLDGGAEI